MKINISIDDVSPHPQSNAFVLEGCYSILEAFPDAKFTLFVPINYTRKGEPSFHVRSNPAFCQFLKQLPRETFEIGYHGYYHGILGKSNNDEFETFNRSEALNRFLRMIEEGREAGIPFKSIFRPPAWRMSSVAISTAIDIGMKVITLSRDDYATKNYGSYVHKPGVRDKIVYYDSAPPHKPLVVKDKLSVVYHACQWDKNLLHEKHVEELDRFLFENDHEFCFMEEMLDGKD